jgi:hypothetical protein
MIGAILRWLTSGPLDRVFDLVDRQVAAQTDRERIKADLIATHLRTRADFMRAGGVWLMLLFALPFAFWWGAVILYSVLWCRGCAFPQPWTIAALPAPLDQWGGWIMTAIFGVIGVSGLRR